MPYNEARKLYFKEKLYFKKNIRKERTKEILKHLTKIKPKTLLDMGCGTGFNTFEMSKKVCLVVGVDISEEVCIGSQYKNETKTENIEFLRCDAKSLPFKDCSFDVVNASQILEHIPDVNSAISEIRRVSKEHIFVDVPTLLWEVYYYSFAIWGWLCTHPKYVISKFIKKIRRKSVSITIKEMWIGDHVNKFGTAKWIQIFQKDGIEVKEYKKICGQSILFIHGIRMDKNTNSNH